MITRAALRAFSTQSLKVNHNVAKQQFTISMSGDEAFLEYDKSGKNITFKHTEVPEIFHGKGVGKLLAEHAFDYAVQKKLDVTIECTFLGAFYNKNKAKYKSLKVSVE